MTSPDAPRTAAGDAAPTAGRTAGRIAGPPTILFACVHNGGRSLAAKVLAAHYAGPAAHVRSAGSAPGAGLNPAVVAVLHRNGLSTTGEAPQLLTPDAVGTADVVVTMGCGESCPVAPGVRYEDWPLDDPAGADPATVQRIVAEVDVRVRDLLTRLGIAVPATPAIAGG